MKRDQKTKKSARVEFDPQGSDSDLLDSLNALRVQGGLKPLTLAEDFILGELWEREQHALGKWLYTDRQPVNKVRSDITE